MESAVLSSFCIHNYSPGGVICQQRATSERNGDDVNG